MSGNVNARLMVHCGGIHRKREELATLSTPPPTRSWRPVPHAELVSELIRGLEARGVLVASDEYATMGKDDAKLFGVMRLNVPRLDTDEYRMALGLRAANDRTMSIQMTTGLNVFVCDNLAFKGDGAIVLRKRHTSRLDLPAVLPDAIGTFLAKAEAFKGEVERMKGIALADSRAKGIIHDAFAGRSPVLPLRLFPIVSRLYFDDTEQRDKFPGRNLWSLDNSFTEAVKLLKVGPQHRASTRIGRYFGRVLHELN